MILSANIDHKKYCLIVFMKIQGVGCLLALWLHTHWFTDLKVYLSFF